MGPNIALQAAAGNSKTNEYVLPQGDYVVAATSLESDLENPPEGAYTLQAVMKSEPAVGCGVDTFVTTGSVASGAISSADCVLGPRDEINTEEGARYYDRYLFNLAANTPMYIEFESDVAYRLEHWTHRSSGTENETIVSAGSANSKQVFIIESDAFAIHSFVVVAIDPEGAGNYTASFSATGPAAISQHDILTTLYNSTDGGSWTDNTNWLGAEGTECSWYGVQCDGDNKVTALDLNQNNLVGSIPSELGDLISIQFISLGGNQLSGTIPSSIAQLVNLQGIWLWSNQFSGPLPDFFGQMSQLRNLNLSGNQFSGTIPVSYGDLVNILELDLAYNQLSGSIPSELGNLADATTIKLSYNQLSGAVPAQVLALDSVNVWANPNLTGIAFGSPAACDNQTPLALGAAVNGELTPFEDCYIEDERIMADFFRLDLSGESGTTLFKIEAYSDFYYPHVGVLDASGVEGQDIVDTQIQQNGLSFEVALVPGEYVLYIHGGSYQPRNVAATGAYTLSTTVIGQAQVDCVAPTWVNKGVELDAALSSDDCLDTYNDPDRLYDSYNIWLEEGESLITTLTADFESQILHFAGNDFISSTPSTAAGQQQVLTYSAPYSGWHRYAVYASNNTPLAEGDYTIAFFEPPVFGDAQACTEGLPTIALGGSTSAAALDRDTDCYIAGRMSDRYALSLDSDTLFRATMDADGFTPLLSIYNAGAAEPITLNGNSQSNFTAEFYLAAGEYWLAASSGASNGLTPIEGSYELSLTASLPISQLQDSCMVTTTVFAGASLAGEVNTNDCRNGFVADVEARPYFDGYEFTVGAGELVYPALTVDFPVKLAHWFNGAFQQQYLLGAGEDVRISINTAGTHELYVLGQSVNDLGSYQLDLFQSQPDLETIPIAFSFAFTDFRNVVDGVVQTGPSDHVLTGIVDAVMADDDVFEVISLREVALDGNAYVLGDEPGIVAMRANQPALLSLSGNLLDVLVCPGGFGATNDCPFGEEGGFLISEFWSPVAQGGALAGHPALGAAYRDRSIPLNKAGWSAYIVVDSEAQRENLISLYNATGGANWTNNTGWLGAEGTECSWFGVSCENGNVVNISLFDNGLTGTIPSSLSQFSELRTLRLNNNQLTGSIPVELAQLSKLSYLSLASNQLTGVIPAQLSQLANLTRLLLNQNLLTGAIPSELGQLSSLTHLYLHQNELSGAIPTSLGQLSNLIQLFVHENQLTGSIPTSLGQLNKMTHLVLSFNSLSGEIPTELGQLSSLQKLFARGNQFTGAIPAEFAQLSNLTELYLADNQLSGSIPAVLTQLNKLTILDLENNNLTGALPAFAGSVAVNVDGNSLDVPPTQQVYLNGLGKVFKGVFNNLPIFYDVTDGDSTLTGLGFHIYFDSTQVDSIAFANVFNASLLTSDDSGAEDSNDSDNDPSTDRFITIGWADVSGNWPGSLPVKLFDLRVKLDGAMSANDQLVLNFVRSTNTTGYELELPQLSLAVSTETLDVDGNGKVEALTDGLLIIRRLFGFSGAVLIDSAIANDAVLTTAEAIVARVQQMDSILDVDGDGKVEALTDGLLIIRYLFGFRGNVLVANAIGSGATRTTPSQIEEYLAALVP